MSLLHTEAGEKLLSCPWTIISKRTTIRVVAEEVHNLAQRSAEAASSTSELIAQSQENAKNGVDVTEKAQFEHNPQQLHSLHTRPTVYIQNTWFTRDITYHPKRATGET